jgi:hypothetical protein
MGLFPNTAYAHNIGAFFAGVPAHLPGTAIVAGTGANGAFIFGAGIQRTKLTQIHESCKVQVHGKATLGTAQSIVGVLKVQISLNTTDGSNGTWTDYTYTPGGDAPLPSSTVTVAPGTAGTYDVLAELNVDLAGVTDWFRVAFQPTLSAGSVDSFSPGSGLINFGGGPDLPVVA